MQQEACRHHFWLSLSGSGEAHEKKWEEMPPHIAKTLRWRVSHSMIPRGNAIMIERRKSASAK
eukprot:5861594-Amphidinium_carterae.2